MVASVSNILRKEIWPQDMRLVVEVLTRNPSGIAFWKAMGYSDYRITLEIMPNSTLGRVGVSDTGPEHSIDEKTFTVSNARADKMGSSLNVERMITRLDHIQLAMPQDGEAEARRFFADLLRMDEEEKPKQLASRGGCWFRSGAVIVHLGAEKNFNPQRKAHPAFCVLDLEVVSDRLLAAGFPIEKDEALPGIRRVYTQDPFGNRIELIQDGDGFGQK